MVLPSTSTQSNPSHPRTLILSQSKIKLHVSQCIMDECERVISSIDQADVLAPQPRYPKYFNSLKGVSNRLCRAVGLKNINPLVNTYTVEQDYDLFFFYCQYPADLVNLNAVKGWREKCRKAVCWIDEIWNTEVDRWRKHLTLLQDFDQVFLSFDSSVDRVSQVANITARFLPHGVDAIKFCPYPITPQRSIDVYSAGRRPPIVHQALVDLAAQQDFFYIHDTIGNLTVLDGDHQAHRAAYANALKRCRYFVANKPKFNAVDQPGMQEVTSSRFFEGAAAGTVMIGIPPIHAAFDQLFDWDDVVLPVPIDASNVGELLAAFDAQPDRLEQIRRNNIINSLLRHDWSYRWETVLKSVGLAPLPQLLDRQQQLSQLADLVKKQQQVKSTPSEKAAEVAVIS